MQNIYDVNLKTLIDDHLANWVAFLGNAIGLPVAPAETLVSADLNINRRPDRLIRVDSNPPYILHLELQASSDLGLQRSWIRASRPQVLTTVGETGGPYQLSPLPGFLGTVLKSILNSDSTMSCHSVLLLCPAISLAASLSRTEARSLTRVV
jgi:hypothetical protein